MSNLNCWEATACGMEHVCPVPKLVSADGYLGGTNGGRGCAFIAPTFCDGSFQPSLEDKKDFCRRCNFYWQLKKDHGDKFNPTSFFEYLSTTDRKRELIIIH